VKHLTQAPSEASGHPPDGGVKHKPSPKTLTADIFLLSCPVVRGYNRKRSAKRLKRRLIKKISTKKKECVARLEDMTSNYRVPQPTFRAVVLRPTGEKNTKFKENTYCTQYTILLQYFLLPRV